MPTDWRIKGSLVVRAPGARITGARGPWGNSWTAAGDFAPQTIHLLAGDTVELIGAINQYAGTLQVKVSGSSVGPAWTASVTAFGCQFTAPSTDDYVFDLDGGGTIDEAGNWLIALASV